MGRKVLNFQEGHPPQVSLPLKENRLVYIEKVRALAENAVRMYSEK